ncbi:MAG: acyl carrier protein [Akkermansia sp.]|nr:acyl carrier protein [Akkermansia sp.]
MDTQAFLEQMKDILDIEDRELSLDDEFRSYDEWDSLAHLSTVAMIDDEYGVAIDSVEFRGLNTLGDIVKLIEAKQ